METYLTVILAIVAYFLGSISFSYIFTKKNMGQDIREIDIKNAGALNVLVNVNKMTGIMVGLLDIAKTLVIVLIGEALGLYPPSIIMAASLGVIGHCFPIYYKFSGGKGAASVIGILIYYIPLELVISVVPALLVAFFIGKLGTAPVFIFLFSPILAYIFGKPASLVWASTYLVLLTGVMNLIIIFIKRRKKVPAS
jgi:acyl phosphate:glycerol-3-phosphate acyltransferase